MKIFVSIFLLSSAFSFGMEEEVHSPVRVSERNENRKQYIRYQEERDQLLSKRNSLIHMYGEERARSATDKMKEEAFRCNQGSIDSRILVHREEEIRCSVYSVSPSVLSLLSVLCVSRERLYAYFIKEQCIEPAGSVLLDASCCCCSAACLALGGFELYSACCHWKEKNDARKELAEFTQIEQLRPLKIKDKQE